MFSIYSKFQSFNMLSPIINKVIGNLKQKQYIIFNFNSMNMNRFNKNLVFLKSLCKSNRLVHKFHFVHHSYWPFFISTVVLMLTISCVVFFFFGDLFNLTMSFIFLILISILWWRDVIRESLYEGKHTSQVQFGIKLGVVLVIIIGVIFFISFFWAYVYFGLIDIYGDMLDNNSFNLNTHDRDLRLFLKKNPQDFLIYLSDNKEVPDYFRSLNEGCKRDNDLKYLYRQMEYYQNKGHMSMANYYKSKIIKLENPLLNYRPEFVRFINPESYIKSNLNLPERVLFSNYCEDLMNGEEKARFQMDIEEKLNYKLTHYRNRHKDIFDQFVYIDDLASKKFNKSGIYREYMDDMQKNNYLSSCKTPFEIELYRHVFELIKSGSFDFYVFEHFKGGYYPEDESIIPIEAFDLDKFLNQEKFKDKTVDDIEVILDDYLDEFYDFKKIFFKRIYDPFKECYDNVLLNSSKDEFNKIETPFLDEMYRKLSKDWVYFNEKKAELIHYYDPIIDKEGPFMEVINKEIENPVLTVEKLFSNRFADCTDLWNYWMDQRGYKYVTFNTELGTILLKNKYGIEFHLEIPIHLYDKILQDFENKKKLGQLFNFVEDSILNNFEIKDLNLKNYTIDDFVDSDHLNIYEKLILDIINRESTKGLYSRIIPFYNPSLDLNEFKVVKDFKFDDLSRKNINLEVKDLKLNDTSRKNINLEVKDLKLNDTSKKDLKLNDTSKKCINSGAEDLKLYNAKYEEQLLVFIKRTAPHIFNDLEDFKKFDELHGNFFFRSNVEDLNLEDSKNEDLSTNIRFSSNFHDKLLENLKFKHSPPKYHLLDYETFKESRSAKNRAIAYSKFFKDEVILGGKKVKLKFLVLENSNSKDFNLEDVNEEVIVENSNVEDSNETVIIEDSDREHFNN